jgi:hypothetical protein
VLEVVRDQLAPGADFAQSSRAASVEAVAFAHDGALTLGQVREQPGELFGAIGGDRGLGGIHVVAGDDFTEQEIRRASDWAVEAHRLVAEICRLPNPPGSIVAEALGTAPAPR